MDLVEPASSLTDLALGLTGVALALALRRRGDLSRHWMRAFAWSGVAGVGGALHHGLIPLASDLRGPSWAAISGLVVIAISYLLAASVDEVLGPGRARAFWVLRSASLVAYAVAALLGYAGIAAILACEAITMLAVLALWGIALSRGHPRAPAVIVAILASGGAAALHASPWWIGPLDPVSLYHLGQTVGLVLLYRAAAEAPRPRPAGAADGAGAPAAALVRSAAPRR
jgi:hypothetical protein